MQSLSDFDSSDSVELRLMSREYTVEGDRPIVHLFGRDASGERHWYEVTGHRPSLFIRAEEHESSVDNHYAVVDTKYRDEDGNEFQDLDGNQLVKVEATTPERVSDLRDMFEWTGEADVFYVNRFAIDTGIKTGVKIDISDVSDGSFGGSDGRVDVSACSPLSTTETPTVEPRICHFDIEVAAENGVPDADRAEEPVSSIVALTDGRYTGWILRSDEWDVETPAEFTDPDARSTEVGCHDVRVFSDESELLDDFHSYIEDTDPDILTGWNSNGFDIPYLINRSKNLSTYGYQRWSPLGETFVGRFDPCVKGRACVDMMGAFEKTQIHELDSKALSDVAADVTDYEKVDIDQSHIEMWQENPVEFLRYNKVDTELVHRIDTAVGATDLLGNLRDLIGCSWTDPIGGNIDMMDIFFLRKAREYGYVLPTATKPDTGYFHGAYVYQPTSGLHEKVVYPDYSSLYPYQLYQCNISPETLIGDEDDFQQSEYTEDEVVWSYHDPHTPADLKEDVEATDEKMERLYFVAPWVQEGFVRAVLDDILGMCDAYTGGMYLATKRIRNSTWGVMGDSDSYNRGFRLFDWRLGEATTLGGQKILKEGSKMFAEEVNEHANDGDETAEVIYGDTDSCVTTIPFAGTAEDALRIAQASADTVNPRINEYAADTFGLRDASDAQMELEIESYASGIFFKGQDDGKSETAVKKRYAQRIVWNDDDLWLDEPEVEIKGFEYVRSDVAAVTKTVQYDIFEALLTTDSTLDIEQYLSDVVSDIVSGQYDDDKLGIPFGMSKHPTEYGSADRTPQPQYRGAKFANEFIYHGDAMQSGDKPKYYYIVEGATGGEVPSHYQSDTKEDGDCVDAVSVMNASDLPEGCRIDYPKMARKTVLDPCQAILRTLGLDPSVVEDVIRRETPSEYRRSDGQTGLSASEWM